MTRRGKVLAWSGGVAAVLAVVVGGGQWLLSRPSRQAPPQQAAIPADRIPAPAAEGSGPAQNVPAPAAGANTAPTPMSVTARPVVRPFTWSATREGTGIRLSGHVPSPEARAIVLDLARRKIGGVPVVDEMREAAGLDAAVDFASATGAALGALAELRTGSVELSDRRLGVRGEAPDKDGLAAVTAVFRNLPNGLEASAVAVTAAVVAPYTFAAERLPGAVVLSGYVPSAEARAEIARQIRARFFHEQIVDRARLADGAPASFMASAAFALDQLAQLATGEASVTGDSVRIAGDMLYAQAAEQIRDRIAKGAPSGGRAFAEIKVRGQTTVRAEASP